MRAIIISSVIPMAIFIADCRSSEHGRKSPPDSSAAVQNASESTKVAVPHQTGAQTTIKQNSSFVTAVIDSIIPVDEFRYRLYATVLTVEARGAMENLAESNQKLELRPEYTLNDRGVVDTNDERNKSILRLRSAHPGETFSGKVSLTVPGGWIITLVEKITPKH